MNYREFEETTLAEFEALESRRAVDIRYARFNAALVASTLINANRTEDSEPVHPYDFIPGLEDEEDKENARLRKSAKKSVIIAFVALRNKNAEEIQTAKSRIIENLQESGIEDPEELIREVFPTL